VCFVSLLCFFTIVFSYELRSLCEQLETTSFSSSRSINYYIYIYHVPIYHFPSVTAIYHVPSVTAIYHFPSVTGSLSKT
jgi:hypothetical protein